jgi:hypothetical protein
MKFFMEVFSRRSSNICHPFEVLFCLDFSLVLQENFSTGVDTRNGQSAKRRMKADTRMAGQSYPGR